MRWDPDQYERFAAERARPFVDLLARVEAEAPTRVVDLGCGPGTLTATLLDRWPGATVEGIDTSSEMVDKASSRDVPGRLNFRLGDVRDWRPTIPVDVVLANAVLQWVPDHLDLLPQLVDGVAPGGWLAFQVPANFDEPSHRLIAQLQEASRWRGLLEGKVTQRLVVAQPGEYLERLAALECATDVWETTYLHVLPGEDAVLEWVKGTGLRPVLAALPDGDREEFIETYAEGLRRAYPPRGWGTVLPFRRIFVVARRRTS
jgi:trans-aconitate 2-methyltransferase